MQPFWRFSLLSIGFLISCLVAALVSHQVLAGDLCFSRSQTFPVGNGPYSMCALDLNNDTFTDYVVANYDDNSIGVYRTNSLDNIIRTDTYDIGSGPFSGPTFVTTADINGDPYIDLVVALSDGGVIGLMKGIPNARFLPATFIGAGAGPIWIDVGDIDGDGDNDLVTANAAGNSMSTLRNDGSGTFSLNSTQLVGLSPHCVLLRDFDGDSDLDVVSVNRKSQDICILFNDGSGQFGNRTRFAADQELWNAAADDYDGDGDLDVLVTNHIQNNVEVFINDSSGHFLHGSSYPVGLEPMGIIAVDLNNDGLNDLAVTNHDSQSMSVLMNSGGNYLPATETSIGGTAITLTSTDNNHDGLMDLALPLNGNGEILVNLNQGDLGFPSVLSASVANAVDFAQSTDINRDGFPDLVSLNLTDGNLCMTAFNYLGHPVATSLFATPQTPVDAFASDLDNDGDIDLAIATIFDGKIAVLTNIGNDGFESTVTVSTDWSFGEINGADFDHDGDVDLVARITGITVSPGMVIFENDGEGGFIERPEIVFSPLDAYSFGLDCVDINGDDDIDLVVSRGNVAIYYGSVGLSFLPAVELAVPGGFARSAAVADFDGDGDLDIAANQTGQHQVLEFVNNGSAGFAAIPLGVVPFSPDNEEYILAIDVDANGWTDLALSSGSSFLNFTVIQNDSAGFAMPQSLHFGNLQLAGAFDAEGDGDQDLIFHANDSRRLSIYLNCADPVYLPGDCNGDGRVSVSDAVFLLNYIFAGGKFPVPRLLGDINHDSRVNISDVVRIVNYLFLGEPIQ